MKLSIPIIASELSDLHPESRCTTPQHIRNLRVHEPLTGKDIRDDCLYLVADNELEQFNPGDLTAQCNFLCRGKPSERLLESRANFIWVDKKNATKDLVIRLTDIFNAYGVWEMRINRSLLQNSTLSNILSIAQERIQRRLWLWDTRGNATPGNDSIEAEEEETLACELAIASNDKFASSREPFSIPGSQNDATWLCRNLFSQGKRVATIGFACSDPETATGKDYALIEFIGGYVLHDASTWLDRTIESSETLSREGQQKPETCIQLLLDQTFVSKHTIEQAARFLSWRIDDIFRCVVIEDESLPDINALTVLGKRLLPESPAWRYVIHNNQIAAIVNDSKTGDDFARQLSTIQARISSAHLDVEVGVSTKWLGFKRISHGYRQAAEAIRIGRRGDQETCIHLFENCAVDFIIQQCSENNPLDSIIVPHGLKRLRRYDLDHGADLTHVLRVFLDNDRSMARTSEELFIHRNTLRYRLERIQDITQLDLSIPDVRLVASLSLRMLDKATQES